MRSLISSDVITIIEDYVLGKACHDFEYFLAKAKGDIKFEWLIGKKEQKGQVIAALALMAWTEFMGSLLPNPSKYSNQQFKDFFMMLNSRYANFLQSQESQGKIIYNIFRCGLIHNLFIKGDCTIAIPNNKRPFTVIGPPDEIIQRPVSIGIGEAQNGKYWFVLEKYYDDFKLAVQNLLTYYRTPLTPKPPSISIGDIEST
jgi:hypothetical protein